MELSLPEISSLLRESFPLRHLKHPALLEETLQRWTERHRVWHSLAHLQSLVRNILASPAGEDREILLLAAVYHDAIYDPTASDNEESSALLLLDHAAIPASPDIEKAARIIRDSKWTSFPTDPLSQRFFDLDTFQLSSACPLGRTLRLRARHLPRISIRSLGHLPHQTKGIPPRLAKPIPAARTGRLPMPRPLVRPPAPHCPLSRQL